MDKLYQRINYENSPSKKTPLSEANLNKMDKALDDLDNRIIEQDAAFAKSIEEEGKKIEEVRGKVSEIAGKATALTQSKADAIVCSASGERITATDSAEAGFEQFRTFGWGKQEKTSGNQLAEKVIVSQSSNNLNRYSPVLWIEADLKPETTYTISFEGTVGNSLYINENITAYKQFKVVSGITTLTFTTVSNMDKANTNKYDSSNGWIIFKNDAAQTTANVFNNVMLVEGSTALPWEPYTGGISAPNPEYPQPIVSAGQKLAKGKNLWNSDLELNFTATDTYRQVNLSGWKFVAGTMKILGSVRGFTSSRMVLWAYDSSGNLVINNALPCTITLSQTQADSITRVSVAIEGVTSGVTYTGKLEIMATTDTEATEYEPYTGGVKVAYDVGISKKLTGKNLLPYPFKSQTNTQNGITFTNNNDGSVTANGTATADCYFRFVDSLVLDNECILSDAGTTKANTIFVYAYNQDTKTYYYTYSNQTPTLPAGKYDVNIKINSGATVSNAVFKPMIRLASIEDDTYEPYTEQTLTLDRVLHGIPTTLASMATYTDENGQMRCADYIDVDRKVLVQRCYCEDILRSKFRKTVHTNTVTYGISCEPYVGAGGNAVGSYCSINNKYGYHTADASHWYVDQSINIWVPIEYEATVDALDYISVCYPLATPIETPMTDEEIAAYKALHSNKPTTIITNDAGCYMEVEYVADPKNHIAQNYVPVTAFNDVLDRISALERLHV